MDSLLKRAEAQRHLNNLELIKGYINSQPELFVSSVLPDPLKWVAGEIAAILLELQCGENEKAAGQGDLDVNALENIPGNSIHSIRHIGKDTGSQADREVTSFV